MRQFLIIGALLALAGCGDGPAPTAPEATAPSACTDGAARFEGTGLCPAEAAALLVIDPDVRTPELPDCTWALKELLLPGDEALLYHAATCNGVTTELAFAGGAKSAEIRYARSAAFGEAAGERVLIRLFGTDPDPQGALKAAMAEAPGQGCEIRPLGYEGWPADALAIAPSAEARAKLPADQPVIACGPLGLDETQVRYWRVRQGYAWFFDLGAAELDFDAGNLAVIVKGADGAWRLKP